MCYVLQVGHKLFRLQIRFFTVAAFGKILVNENKNNIDSHIHILSKGQGRAHNTLHLRYMKRYF